MIFLLRRMTGNTEAGKTTNASDAKNQSLMKATTTSTISEVVSFRNEARASVKAERKRVTSLATREINVPLGWPLRYSHTAVEVADLRDLESLARMVVALAGEPAVDDPDRP